MGHWIFWKRKAMVLFWGWWSMPFPEHTSIAIQESCPTQHCPAIGSPFEDRKGCKWMCIFPLFPTGNIVKQCHNMTLATQGIPIIAIADFFLDLEYMYADLYYEKSWWFLFCRILSHSNLIEFWHHWVDGLANIHPVYPQIDQMKKKHGYSASAFSSLKWECCWCIGFSLRAIASLESIKAAQGLFVFMDA